MPEQRSTIIKTMLVIMTVMVIIAKTTDCFGLFIQIILMLTWRCGQAASSVGSSSSGSNSAPVGLDDGGNVLNMFTANCKGSVETVVRISFHWTEDKRLGTLNADVSEIE